MWAGSWGAACTRMELPHRGAVVGSLNIVHHQQRSRLAAASLPGSAPVQLRHLRHQPATDGGHAAAEAKQITATAQQGARGIEMARWWVALLGVLDGQGWCAATPLHCLQRSSLVNAVAKRALNPGDSSGLALSQHGNAALVGPQPWPAVRQNGSERRWGQRRRRQAAAAGG